MILNQATDYIHPTDVKIYMEDEKPYLEYTGIIDHGDEKIKVYFPKIDLTFNVLEHIEERQDFYDQWRLPIGSIILSQQIMVGNTNTAYEYKIIERTMTKKDLEKKLGYKVNIV